MRKPQLPGGWFSGGDIYSYRELVRQLPEKGRMVEVGCWMGRSICSVSEEIKILDLDVHLVDLFIGPDSSTLEKLVQDYLRKFGITELPALNLDTSKVSPDVWLGQLKDNLQAFDLREHVSVLPVSSVEAAQRFENASLDGVFIDGDHTEEGVLTDLQTWNPKVKPGGWVAGHDLKLSGGKDAEMYRGVKTALEKFYGDLERVKKNQRQQQTTVWHVRRES